MKIPALERIMSCCACISVLGFVLNTLKISLGRRFGVEVENGLASKRNIEDDQGKGSGYSDKERGETLSCLWGAVVQSTNCS